MHVFKGAILALVLIVFVLLAVGYTGAPKGEYPVMPAAPIPQPASELNPPVFQPTQEQAAPLPKLTEEEAAKANAEIEEWWRAQKAHCEKIGGEYQESPGRIRYCKTPEDVAREKECLDADGTWGPRGMAGVPGCVKPMKDGGKDCQTNDDCLSKRCLTDGDNKKHGACAETDASFGCFSYFTPGNASPKGICID